MGFLFDYIGKHPLIKEQTPAAKELLAKVGKADRYDNRDVLRRQSFEVGKGNDPKAIMVISAVLVELIYDKDGNVSAPNFYLPGEIVLPIGFPLNCKEDRANLILAKKGVVSLVPVSTLKELYKKYDETKRFLHDSISKSYERQCTLSHLRTKKAEECLVWLLKENGRQPHGIYSFPARGISCAKICGISYEHFYRIRTKLMNDGVIERIGHNSYLIKQDITTGE